MDQSDYLLTNDDGIDAPGLRTLNEIMRHQGRTFIVAPHVEQSGVSHRVTDSAPVVVQEHGENRCSVAGTPADCVRVGLHCLERTADWLLSGINAGGNLGSDIYMSGTVAAAREAALLGVKAIALSQYRRTRFDPIDWARTATWAKQTLEQLLSQPLARGEFWNVNFPDPADGDAAPEIVFCDVDPGHHVVKYEQTDSGFVYRGDYSSRDREPGCDVDVCFSGHIAVSRLKHP